MLKQMAASAQLIAYNQFYSTANQSIITLNTPIALTYTNSGPSKDGITYSGSQITVGRTGAYFVSVSVQIGRLVGNTSSTCIVWFRVNGVDVPASASNITMPPTISATLLTVTIMLQLTGGQYIEVMYGNEDAAGHTSAVAVPAQVSPYAAPLSPSIITDVFYMGQG